MTADDVIIWYMLFGLRKKMKMGFVRRFVSVGQTTVRLLFAVARSRTFHGPFFWSDNVQFAKVLVGSWCGALLQFWFQRAIANYCSDSQNRENV